MGQINIDNINDDSCFKSMYVKVNSKYFRIIEKYKALNHIDTNNVIYFIDYLHLNDSVEYCSVTVDKTLRGLLFRMPNFFSFINNNLIFIKTSDSINTNDTICFNKLIEFSNNYTNGKVKVLSWEKKLFTFLDEQYPEFYDPETIIYTFVHDKIKKEFY
ncbi:MAG: hypothetical protein Q8880_07890, partial [Bacteroidota bacterium]|nr:hypothetical protein [Bacteroidota bacterium]